MRIRISQMRQFTNFALLHFCRKDLSESVCMEVYMKHRRKKSVRIIGKFAMAAAGVIILAAIIYTPVRKHLVTRFLPNSSAASLETPISETSATREPSMPSVPNEDQSEAEPYSIEDNYMFNQLPERQKDLYRTIRSSILNGSEKIELKGSYSSEDVDAVMQVLDDQDYEILNFQPEKGWTNVMNVMNEVVSLQIEYTCSTEEASAMLDEMRRKADEIAAQSEGLSDYEKVVFFNDYLVDDVTYDLEAPNAHNAYGALVEGMAVCDGYALAMNCLLNRAGIETITMQGFSADDEKQHEVEQFDRALLEYDDRGTPQAPYGMNGHAWNAVHLEDGWYYVDTTYNDPSMSDSSHEIQTGKHHYLNLTFDEMEKSHLFAPVRSMRELYPMENNETYSYYRVQGLMGSTMEECRNIFLAQIGSHLQRVELRVTDGEVFEKIRESITTIGSDWAGWNSDINWERSYVTLDEQLQIVEFILEYSGQ